MWNGRVKILIIFVIVLIQVNGKRFETRCKLVRELIRNGMTTRTFLGQWVCLIEKASNRRTDAFTVTPSGRKFYGLYQIPDIWCRERKRGGGCNIACEALLDEDIRDDTMCAVWIAQWEGFKYWRQWTAKCKNNNFFTYEIYKCPDLNQFTPHRSFSSAYKYKRILNSRRKRSIYRNASQSHQAETV